MQFESFTISDVERLKENPTEITKIDLIKKLSHNFNLEKLSENEKVIAEEILRYLAADISVRIRQNIATKFAENLALPHDIALKLANDMEDIVAVPIIERSTVLSEVDLIAIIEQGSVNRQKAVANRVELSDNLCAHIIYQASPEAVEVLVNNKKVPLSESNSENLLKKFSQDQSLVRAMITSKKVTLEQAHGLLTKVSDDLQKMLIVEYEIPKSVVNNLVHDSKEWMILNMILDHAYKRPTSLPLKHIIDKLHATGDLTFSILVKALSLGDILFFEGALAKMANIPMENVSKLMWEHGKEVGFKPLYQKCGLPDSMLEPIYALASIVREEKMVVDTNMQIQHRVLNKLLNASTTQQVNNLDYLVTIVTYNLKKSNLL